MQDRSIAESLRTRPTNSTTKSAPYFQTALGPHLKYSAGYWPSPLTDLAASEAAMLKLSCERADLQDGQCILELGCGWGSLSLWMAAHYPNSHITAVSNSLPAQLHPSKHSNADWRISVSSPATSMISLPKKTNLIESSR